MTYQRALVLFLSSVLALVAGSFIQSPASINATLGSSVEFQCNIDSGYVYWLLNGSEPHEWGSDRTYEAYTENNINSILRFTALKIDDNLIIHCGKWPWNDQGMLSDPAILRVQGLPDAVSNLRASYSPRKPIIKLSWEQPETLDVPGVDPAIRHYIVAIQSSTHRHTFVVNETEYTFQPPETEECMPHEATVKAGNIVGLGEGRLINVIIPGPDLVVNNGSFHSKIVSLTCATFQTNVITWLIIAQGKQNSNPLLGKILTLRQHDPVNEQYSETVYVDSELLYKQFDANISIQCLGIRVCSKLDVHPCLTSVCKSNTLPFPRLGPIIMTLSSSNDSKSEVLVDTTKMIKTQVPNATVNDTDSVVKIHGHGSFQWETNLYVISGSFGGCFLVALLLLIMVTYLYCSHRKRVLKLSQLQAVSCKEPPVEVRIYESVLSIPGTLKQQSPTPTVFSTHECPAYQLK